MWAAYKFPPFLETISNMQCVLGDREEARLIGRLIDFCVYVLFCVLEIVSPRKADGVLKWAVRKENERKMREYGKE
jgi:hypothetical protein